MTTQDRTRSSARLRGSVADGRRLTEHVRFVAALTVRQLLLAHLSVGDPDTRADQLSLAHFVLAGTGTTGLYQLDALLLVRGADLLARQAVLALSIRASTTSLSQTPTGDTRGLVVMPSRGTVASTATGRGDAEENGEESESEGGGDHGRRHCVRSS